MPLSWRIGEAFLIQRRKTNPNHSCLGTLPWPMSVERYFVQVLANRLLTFMVENGYIDQTIQKGYLPGIAGCIEHTQTLMETLLDAKQNTKEIVVAWLDLANAYRSVAHNLIQFALEWYHVPPDIRELIHTYYGELFVPSTYTEVDNWLAHVPISLFQGCPLSVVLFLIVLNLLLDLLKTKRDLGYQLKNADFKQTQKAYADDLTIITDIVDECKELLHLVETFLNWTRTMKAKHTKCKSLALRNISVTQQNGKISASHTPYDPHLCIGRKQIPFIHQTSMRFLGQEIFYDFSDKEVGIHVNTKLNNLLDRADRDLVNNNHIVSRIAMGVHHLLLSYIVPRNLEAIATATSRSGQDCPAVLTHLFCIGREKTNDFNSRPSPPTLNACK